MGKANRNLVNPDRKIPTAIETPVLEAIAAGGSGYEGMKRSGRGAGFRQYNRTRQLERLAAMGWIERDRNGFARGLTDAGKRALEARHAVEGKTP